MRAETRDGKGETARSGLKRRENGEQKKYETDRQVNEIARRPRKVERERGMEREREREAEEGGGREKIFPPRGPTRRFSLPLVPLAIAVPPPAQLCH